jgi:DNA-binding response OmpR family regulator
MLSSASTPAIGVDVNQGPVATIIVVEDDPDMGSTLSKALQAVGYRVLLASTASDARVLFGEVQPDLIILDLMLPDADGLCLTASFRTLTNAPIVICSARHGQLDRVLSSKLGAADFLAKPFELDDLEARVKAVLRRSQQLDEPPPRRDEIQAWRNDHGAKPRVHTGTASHRGEN